MGKMLGKYYEDIAGRIEDLRKEKGFSQEDMIKMKKAFKKHL